MGAYVVFQLHGPMASWGDIAVGEYRTSWPCPSRSALLGLIAAALGVPRSDGAAQARLRDVLAFAVVVDAPGNPMRDYHTVQTPKRKKGFAPRSRRDELRSSKAGTIQSYRDYYSDAFYRVVIWTTSAGGPSLGEVHEALRHPRFTPYLGRKCCPLGLPLAPSMIEAPTVQAALRRASLPSLLAVLPGGVQHSRVAHVLGAALAPELHWPAGGPATGVDVQRTVVVWDEPASRGRWQFGPRREHVGTLSHRWLAVEPAGDSSDHAADEEAGPQEA